ncbi:MAG: DinB family protein [Desulfobacterales bacterium]|nr:MAG: DinB family protein [Desulfobacterales bacterium]
MTDFKDAIKSGLDEFLDSLKKAVEGLTATELRWQPTLTANPISWIVWHMARVEDRWVNRVLRGKVELWISDGWHNRFGMSEEAHGYGDTADQVRAMPDVAMSDLLDYFDAVRQSTLAHLAQMTPADLETTYPHPRLKGRTGAWILGHILVEESQHLGQVAYIRGMIRGQNQ